MVTGITKHQAMHFDCGFEAARRCLDRLPQLGDGLLLAHDDRQELVLHVLGERGQKFGVAELDGTGVERFQPRWRPASSRSPFSWPTISAADAASSDGAMSVRCTFSMSA